MIRCCASDGCGRRRLLGLGTCLARGVWFDDRWYCSAGCLERDARERLEALRQRSTDEPVRQLPPARLGAWLVHLGVITRDHLDAMLVRQRESGEPLGQLVARRGLASHHDVLRALAAQAGVPYLRHIDPEVVASGPGGLSAATARALGIVPFAAHADVQRLRVACRAPLPRAALGALRELSGWAVEPFLVTDETWRRLSETYGRTSLRRRPGDDAGPVALGPAVAHVTRAALEGRAVRMRHARCAPYLWLRLEGRFGGEDLLLNIDHRMEHSPCPAALTLH